MRRNPFGKGPDIIKLFSKTTHFSRDVSKLMVVVANYTYGFLFTTRTPHLEGEKVFGFAKQDANFSPCVDDELHRPNHIKFFHPCVVVLTC